MAHLIISTEYYANQPSVFLLNDSNYYGCNLYPRGRNYPTTIDYWYDATCSDSDRYFQITEVELTEENLSLIKKLQNVIDANESMITHTNWPFIRKNWKVRRGKVYQEYKMATEEQEKAIREEQERNHPYYIAYRAAYSELRNLLLSFKK